MSGAAMTGPAIILVETQLGENIGHTARAMLNFGLRDLRLVAPRDGWPNPGATSTAVGADGVLKAAKVFENVEGGTIEGTPQAMASRIGIANPSARYGNTPTSQARMSAARRCSGRNSSR